MKPLTTNAETQTDQEVIEAMEPPASNVIVAMENSDAVNSLEPIVILTHNKKIF